MALLNLSKSNIASTLGGRNFFNIASFRSVAYAIFWPYLRHLFVNFRGDNYSDTGG